MAKGGEEEARKKKKQLGVGKISSNLGKIPPFYRQDL
jgi:hypothetical protein